MTTRAHYHPLGIEVDLADLPLGLYNEIASWHGRIKADDPPVLTCLGNGQPLHVYKMNGRYFVRHFANGHGESHGHGALGRGMSDEHRRQAEYSLRAAVTAGYDARLEVSTGNHTRLDVGIYSTNVNVGLEIQRSGLTAPQAKRRATNSFQAGWTTAWVTDQEKDPPWADRVPTARLTTRGGWDTRTLPANTAYVSITTLTRERDRARPSGWWYRREPKAVLLDELAYLMPAGEIVPMSIGTKGNVVLAEKLAANILDSCTYDGASMWSPVSTVDKELKEAAQRYTLDCHHGDGLQPAAGFKKSCSCGQPLWAPISIQRGFCERCNLNNWQRMTGGVFYGEN